MSQRSQIAYQQLFSYDEVSCTLANHVVGVKLEGAQVVLQAQTGALTWGAQQLRL
jgi:hypothetical protein